MTMELREECSELGDSLMLAVPSYSVQSIGQKSVMEFLQKIGIGEEVGVSFQDFAYPRAVSFNFP